MIHGRKLGKHRPAEWNTILQQGFPTNENVLLQLPFGEAMRDAYDKKDARDPTKYLHRVHLGQMVSDMNSLLSGDIRNVIKDQADSRNAGVVADWVRAWKDILGLKGLEASDEFIWRLESFLHDVGKSLTYSKHATRGEYLVTRLMLEQRNMLVQAVGQDSFTQIKKVIAFHDRFGVISTGEGSYAILADAVDRGSTDENAEQAARTISHIMVVNLVDIGASVKGGLMSDKVKVVVDDWRRTTWNPQSPLRKSNGDRGAFEKELLNLAASDEWTIKRAARLVAEGYRCARARASATNTIDPSDWPEPGSLNFESSARQALDALCGIHWDDFKTNLARVAKFDYLLYLVDKIAMVHWTKHRNPDRLAVCIVGVMQKLTDHFAHLIQRESGRSRIGIDLSVLRDTPEVQDRIAELLSGDAADFTFGLEWLSRETGAWPF